MANHGTESKTLYMREVVRSYMEDHLGCSPKEICYGTGLSTFQVAQAWTAIRAEWEGKQKRGDVDAVHRGTEAVANAERMSFFRVIKRAP